VSLFVSSSSLNGFDVEKLVSSIQRKVSEYISTNEMGFFCNNNNTHTYTKERKKNKPSEFVRIFEMLAAATYLPGTYLPKYLPIHPFFCFCFGFFFPWAINNYNNTQEEGLRSQEGFWRKKNS
jgi:hypothetical protein